jgi:nanoRNase/pAp phosphatase (c-di-AMP/oligoRNAs hydrolase)
MPRRAPTLAVADAFGAAESAISGNEALAAGVLVAALLAAIGGGAVWLYIRRPPAKRFASLLGNQEDVSVLMHPNPDPDAMACALAVHHIAEWRGTEATLHYSGEIRHQENRAFRTVLDLDADTVTDAQDLGGEVILVDHNEPRGFDAASTVEPLAVIDHHPGDGEGTSFTDIRTDYGACATILTEYLRDLNALPAREDDAGGGHIIPRRVATGLLYGIHSDTSHLTSGCHSADFDASAFLFPGIDGDDLERIANPEVDAEVLEILARAIRDRDVRGSFAIADVGSVSNVDAIPQAADELVRLEGVTAVAVFGENDGRITLSGRSRDDRVHMGDALAAVVDDIPMATAGGHARMGGGELSVDHMEGLATEGVGREALVDRLFDAMNGELQ